MRAAAAQSHAGHRPVGGDAWCLINAGPIIRSRLLARRSSRWTAASDPSTGDDTVTDGPERLLTSTVRDR
jgi:hypothetical protein